MTSLGDSTANADSLNDHGLSDSPHAGGSEQDLLGFESVGQILKSYKFPFERGSK